LKDNVLLGGKVWLGKENPADKVWLMVGTLNNLHSLQVFQENLPDTIWVATSKEGARLTKGGRISLHRSFWYWYTKPALLLGLFRLFGSMVWRRSEEWTYALGIYEAAIGVLRKHKPKALLFANDHAPEMRALLFAAKKLGIPTVYIQHASVSTLFPPLRYDLNLLEGQDAWDKYKQCGPVEGEVKLIGMPKFDQYHTDRKPSTSIKRIGICGTLFDDDRRIANFIQALAKALPEMALAFRPHPRDDRHYPLPPQVRMSSAREESIFSFLKNQDVLIAGDTSTHLEAVLLNMPSLYVPFTDQLSDYYGFAEKGLVENIGHVEAAVAWIQEHQSQTPTVYTRAQYYNAVVGTPQEGGSGLLAVEAVRELLENC
jgi:hypothetical protein